MAIQLASDPHLLTVTQSCAMTAEAQARRMAVRSLIVAVVEVADLV